MQTQEQLIEKNVCEIEKNNKIRISQKTFYVETNGAFGSVL